MSEAPERDETGGSEPRAMSLLAAAAWTIALVLAMSIAVQVTESARPGAMNDLVNDTACQLFAYSLLLFAMVRAYAPTSPMRAAIGMRAVSPVHVLLALVIGAALAPGMAIVDELMAKRFPQSTEEIESLTKLLTATTIGARVALVVTLVVAVPIAEELFFRGILFGGLRRGRTAGIAMVATTVFYATFVTAGQMSPRFLVTTFAIAMVLAWLRAQSGSVVSPMVAHVAFQAVQVAPLLRGGDPNADYQYPRTWAIGGVAIAIVALLAARVVASRDERAAAADHDDA